jgi:hypothetical protein
MATTITGRIVLQKAQDTGYKMWLGRLLNKLVREHIMPYLDVEFETDALPAITGGYTYVTTLYYTTAGTYQFVKANYPWLRGIRAIVTAAGGGGGGSGTNGRSGGSGAAGGTGIKWFNEAAIAALPSSADVVVGAGGSGGAAGENDGSPGGSSSFGSVTVPGGLQGNRSASGHGGIGQGASGADLSIRGGDGASGARVAGGFPGLGGADLSIPGGDGTSGTAVAGGFPGLGGASYWGGGPRTPAATDNRPGPSGRVPGTGGSGGYSHDADVAGGTGADGIVVLELYA